MTSTPAIPSSVMNSPVCALAFWLVLIFVGTPLCSVLGQSVDTDSADALPEASASDLPRWRGFNLLEMFHLEWSNKPFVEKDFRMIHELGFNFVRLPMDYRTWIKDRDWNQLDERQLKQIDQAVAWGKQYGIHVCINFHRAPGYSVASPVEPTNLWTDKETQRVCAKHWAEFARRYRGISNRHLSFNLFNEPPDEAGQAFIDVVGTMVAAIRSQDPERLIISDGLSWGQKPVLELAPLKIAQATRGYTPFQITHYKANWVEGSDHYANPVWPRPQANGMIYSVNKPAVEAEVRVPMSIRG